MTSIGELVYSDYHGTSIGNAREIEQNRFRTYGGVICFAPLDNLAFAMKHGRNRAQEQGDATFGVVHASFPPIALEFGLGGDQINVPASDVGNIIVRQVLEFAARPSGLYAPK